MPLPKFCTVAASSSSSSAPRTNNKKRGKNSSKKVEDRDKIDETVNAAAAAAVDNSKKKNSSINAASDSNDKNNDNTKTGQKKKAKNETDDDDIGENDDDDAYEDDEDEENDDCDDDDDDDDDDASCLHCHLGKSSTKKVGIQVRCDECGSYICNTCHWCHEFQANHEIRVCDRCDAFYCRNCDEMDQCDDCGEVVCATCSTLLSCKFCGGGLCEDCATACGRCGIVLCSKDAKFAVDCDTCRLSYCLVCLASGNKDPCVRCGHRPSKRMEQLVHLRLKSIYKAFKQSSSTTSSSTTGNSSTTAAGGCGAAAAAGTRSSINSSGTATTSNSTTASGSNSDGKNRAKSQHPRHSNTMNNINSTVDVDCLDEYDVSDDPTALMMAAAATASAVHKATAAAAKGVHSHSSHASFTSHAASSAGFAAKHKREAAAAAAAAAAATNSTNAVKEAVEKYKAEKAKADAAAAALLAELDEEEEQVNAKKRKKKKKKQQQQQQKVDDGNANQKVAAATSTRGSSANDASKTRLKDPPASSMIPSRYSSIQDDDSDSDSDSDDDDIGRQPRRKEDQRGRTPSPNFAHDDELQDASSHESETAHGAALTNSPAVDTLEQEFASLEEDENIQGLDELLSSIKGVPGRAVLRKNIKKAIKRFKAAAAAAAEVGQLARQQEEDEEDEEEVIALPAVSRQSPSMTMDMNSRPGAVTPVMAEGALRTSDLLKIVPVGAVPACPSSLGTGPRVVKAAAANASPIRSECVMKMSPIIVGWVIGKGGQQIRGLMEESGAKIWIDQDSMAPHEPRIVYVSGYRKNVDEAVRMIKDLVSKAPVETPQSKPQSKAAGVAAPHSAPAEMTQPIVKTLPPAVTGLPDMASTESFRLRPRKAPISQSHHAGASHSHHGRSNSAEVNRARHEITCDPRFVPLLIGRRGWTVKNIQDSSGARVDIDQTVTPRKITISGSDTSVEIAVRMVRDVLSYPHSQLHGTVGHHALGSTTTMTTTDHFVVKSLEETDQLDHTPPPMNSEHFPKPEYFALVAADAPRHLAPSPQPAPSPYTPQVAEQAESSLAVDEAPEPAKALERSQTPPPSSLIMSGDAKSTISASSSLSSTPEPSMASSSKGTIAAVAPGPMLPPLFGSGEQYHGHDSASGFIGFAPSRVLAPGGNMLGFGLANGQASPSLALPSGGPSMLQNPPPPMGNHMSHPSGPFPFGPIAGEHPMSLSMHQQSAFHSSGPGFSQVHPSPDSQRHVINSLQTPNGSGAISGTGMWNQAPSPSHVPQPGPPVGRDGFGLAAAVDFLHHSTAKPPHPAVLSEPVSTHHGTGSIGVNGFMGLPNPSSSAQPEFISIGFERGQQQPLPNPGTPGREDSRIIDSLFGLSDLGVGTGATGIMDGLQGLSLGNDTECPGLWDTMADSSAVRSHTMSISEQPQQVSLFSTTGLGSDLMNNMNDNDEVHFNQHPHQSRFAWGEGQQR